MAVSRYMVYDRASFGLAPYGPLWREIRKLVTFELFTIQCLKKFKNVCNSELKDSIKELSIMSTKNKEGISMDIGGHLKAMKQLAQDLNSVICKWLDEHVEKRKEHNGDKEADLIDVMLSTLSKDVEMFGQTIIKATALVYSHVDGFRNHPHVLKAAQKKLDIQVLKKFNYFDCTSVSTLMDTSEKLRPNNGQAVSQLKYSKAFKKQTCITGSTMEFEFVALAATGKKAEWLKNLLLEITLWFKPISPISIRYDSAATLANAYSQMYNRKVPWIDKNWVLLDFCVSKEVKMKVKTLRVHEKSSEIMVEQEKQQIPVTQGLPMTIDEP
ncbi:zinc finger, CCHC-type containing protein [Tanacetum coccineum]